MRLLAVVAFGLLACDKGSTTERRPPVPTPDPVPAPVEGASLCPTSPEELARTPLVFTIDGVQVCEQDAMTLGHAVLPSGKVDIDSQLLFDRGERANPRRDIAAYPEDRPFAVTLSPVFTTRDGVIYTLFFGIGGLTRKDWDGRPISKPVLPGALQYVFAADPREVGAYVQMSRRTNDANGDLKTIGTYTSAGGTVTFRAYDLMTNRYAGTVELTFKREGKLAPTAGSDTVIVTGTFDLPAEEDEVQRRFLITDDGFDPAELRVPRDTLTYLIFKRAAGTRCVGEVGFELDGKRYTQQVPPGIDELAYIEVKFPAAGRIDVRCADGTAGTVVVE